MTAGFYTKIDDNDVLYGTIINFPDGTMLHIDEHDQHTYPVNNWYWFDSEAQAKDFFGIVNKE